MRKPSHSLATGRRASGASRGFVLVTVLVLLAVISMFCVSMISAVTFEKRMTRRAAAISELKASSDTLLNYAGSQVSNNPLLVMRAPMGLRLPPADKDVFFPGGSDALTMVRTGAADREIISTPLVSIENPNKADPYWPKFLIDPSYPINAGDKLAGMSVSRDLCIIATKSSVKDPVNPSGSIYEYAAMVLERRGVPLFNYLGFFDVARFRVTNAGSDITLDGPIQSNKGIYFEASSSTTGKLYMDSSVHTPGILEFSGSTKAGMFNSTNGTSRVDMLKPGKTVLRQTSDDRTIGADKLWYTADDKITGTSFVDFMNTTTKGNLRTGDNGEQPVLLDGLNYVDDTVIPVLDANGKPTYDKNGVAITKPNPDTAHKDYWVANNRRIDPPNPALRNDTSGDYADAQVAEYAKTAYTARLYAYVEQNGTLTVFTSLNETDTPQSNAEAYKANTTDAARAAWKAANPSKFLDKAEAAAFIAMPYVERYNTGATDYTSTSKNTDIARGAIFDSQQNSTVAMVDVDIGKLNEKLKPKKPEEPITLKMADGSFWDAKGTSGWNGVLYVDVQNPASRPSAPVKDKVTGQYVGSVYDPVTKTTVIKPDSSITVDTAIRVNALPSLNITGGAQNWSNGAAVTDTTGLTGVRILNAKTVPSALIGDTPGFTLATNTATYSVGSINADGDTATGTTSLQDGQKVASDALLAADKTTNAIPAAIFSDKHIVLSDDFYYTPNYDTAGLLVPKPTSYPPGMTSANWPFNTTTIATTGDYTMGGKGNGQYQYALSPSNRGKDPDPAFSSKTTRVMELNAGFIIGDDESSNKGIHTMLSFLQPFHKSNDTLRMRGAVIGIYKARYFNAPAGSFNDYYTAPSRDYGFSSLFKGGKMPPSAPTTSNFRRMRQFTISADDYAYLASITAQTFTAAGVPTDPNAATRGISHAVARSILDAWLTRLAGK